MKGNFHVRFGKGGLLGNRGNLLVHSHVGFILLALSVSSIESTQAFIFYLIQYSISNLNAFFIIITIGFSLYSYITNNKEYRSLLDKNNSPAKRLGKPLQYWVLWPNSGDLLKFLVPSYS